MPRKRSTRQKERGIFDLLIRSSGTAMIGEWRESGLLRSFADCAETYLKNEPAAASAGLRGLAQPRKDRLPE